MSLEDALKQNTEAMNRLAAAIEAARMGGAFVPPETLPEIKPATQTIDATVEMITEKVTPLMNGDGKDKVVSILKKFNVQGRKGLLTCEQSKLNEIYQELASVSA